MFARLVAIRTTQDSLDRIELIFGDHGLMRTLKGFPLADDQATVEWVGEHLVKPASGKRPIADTSALAGA